MTSLDGKGICSQLLVLNLVLTRVAALGVVFSVNLCVGYSACQCELAMVSPVW